MMHQPLTLVLCVSLLGLSWGAPMEAVDTSVTRKPESNNGESNVYDQRQNGTDNIRIHLNGVMVFVAPSETVLQIAQLANLQGGESEATGPESPSSPSPVLKPQPRPPSPSEKHPAESSADDGQATFQTHRKEHRE